MRTIGRNNIVVGVDGSPASGAALTWAIVEATRRKLPLHLVCARRSEMHLGVGMADAPELVTTLDREEVARADAVLGEASAQARQASPALVVTVEATDGHPAAALVALSSHADTVVLGNRRHGAIVGTLLGTVATHVASHAECPVVVTGVPDEEAIERHGVVVGVDGSEMSNEALGYAFEQASARRTGLEIVHAWWSNVPPGLTSELLLEQVAQERLAVSESVVGWSEKFSDVSVRQHLPKGPAVFALVEAAKYAQLLVVGSRGRGGIRSLLLGSVSQGVLQHATCPVAVVRQANAVGTQREIVSSTSVGSTGLAT